MNSIFKDRYIKEGKQLLSLCSHKVTFPVYIQRYLRGKILTMDSLTDKSDQTNYAEIQSDFSRDLQAAKVLESDQMVKIAIGNQADSPEETYEPVCESSPAALPRANCSFLWSNHGAKTTFPNDKLDATATCHASKENDEDNDSEGYDDVGPSNFVAQTVRIIVCTEIPLSRTSTEWKLISVN